MKKLKKESQKQKNKKIDLPTALAIIPEEREIPAYLANIELPRPDFSKRLSMILRRENIKTLKQLLDVSEDEMRQMPNFGRTTGDEVKAFLATKNLEWGPHYTVVAADAPAETDIPGFAQMFEMLKNYVKKISARDGDKVKKDIYDLRVNWTARKKTPLDRIAEKYGLSRERVRQKEKKMLDEMGKIIAVNKIAIEQLFEKYGNLVNAKDVPELCGYRDYFLAFRDAVNEKDFPFHFDKPSQLLYQKMPSVPRLALSKMTMTEAEIDAELKEKIRKAAGTFPPSADAEKNLVEAQKILKKLYIQKEFYYFVDYNCYVLRRRLRKFRYEVYSDVFKKLYPEGIKVHREHERIFADFVKACPKDFKPASSRVLIDKLIRTCDKLILVASGHYRHIDTIHVPAEVIDFAVAECNKKNTARAIHEVFEEHKDYFVKNGVSTKYLLVSLVSKRPDLSEDIDSRQTLRW